MGVCHDYRQLRPPELHVRYLTWTVKMNKSLRLTSAACGGLMLGVAGPTLAASLKQPAALAISLVMLVAGGLLSLSSRFAWLRQPHLKGLLGLHLFVALAMLFVLAFKPHTFLIIWSVLVASLAAVSLRLVNSSGGT